VKPLPRLRRFVEAPAGRVRVRLVKRPRGSDGEECWATFDFATRTIQVQRGVSRFAQWHALFHEQAHVAFDDAGVTMPKDTLESACDAIATARMREEFG
jgi:hypothetical protein